MVKFKNETKRHEFVRAAKGKKISTAMYGYGGDARPIFVDPQLTRESFALFKHAKKLKKIGVAFIWISINGEILIREKPNTAIVNIKTAAQVDEIEREIILRSQSNKSNKNTGHANTRPSASVRAPRDDNGDERNNATSSQYCGPTQKHKPAFHSTMNATNTSNIEVDKRKNTKSGKNNNNATLDLHTCSSATDSQRNTNVQHTHTYCPNKDEFDTGTARLVMNGLGSNLIQTLKESSYVHENKLNNDTQLLTKEQPILGRISSGSKRTSHANTEGTEVKLSLVNKTTRAVSFNEETNVLNISHVIVESDSDPDTTADYIDA